MFSFYYFWTVQELLIDKHYTCPSYSISDVLLFRDNWSIYWRKKVKLFRIWPIWVSQSRWKEFFLREFKIYSSIWVKKRSFTSNKTRSSYEAPEDISTKFDLKIESSAKFFKLKSNVIQHQNQQKLAKNNPFLYYVE